MEGNGGGWREMTGNDGKWREMEGKSSLSIESRKKI